MMSFVEVKPSELVKKQYFFKMKSYSQVFSSLIFLQLLGIFFSIGPAGGSVSHDNYLEIDYSHYSANMVFLFTMIWAFISAVLITTKAYRYDDFVFVTNRVTSHLSNMLFLATISLIGGLCIYLSGICVKVIVAFFTDGRIVAPADSAADASSLFIGALAMVLYLLLVCGFGYLTGMAVQLNKRFIAILPALWLGFMYSNGTSKIGQFFQKCIHFYTHESSFMIFSIKMLFTIMLLFLLSILISNRMEVKS